MNAANYITLQIQVGCVATNIRYFVLGSAEVNPSLELQIDAKGFKIDLVIKIPL